MKKLLLLNIYFFVSCASVNVELVPEYEKTISFVHYSHYGFFGLLGSDSLNIEQACAGRGPVKIKNYFSFEDFLFTLTTVGLYSPKSTRVWCGHETESALKL